MKRIIVIAILALVIFYSCKKDTTIAPPTKTNPPASVSYISLKVGNYWIYEMCTDDSTGTETSLNKTDSLYIQRDTVIGGKTYYYFQISDPNTLSASLPLQNQWVTDSSGFLKYYGQKYVAMDYVHLNDTITRDTMTWGVVINTCPVAFTNDVVPAGTFSGVSMNLRLRYLHPTPHSSPYVAGYSRYSQGIGLVHHRTSFASDPRYGNTWRLVRYHI